MSEKGKGELERKTHITYLVGGERVVTAVRMGSSPDTEEMGKTGKGWKH